MRVLQAGVSKSGNLWLYKIIQGAIRYAGLQQKSYIQNQPIHNIAKTWDLSYEEQADIDVLDIEPQKCLYRISSVFRMPIDDIDEYIGQCSHVWTHSPFCSRSYDVLSKFDKVVYIIRDPRDGAISASRFRFTPYMQKYFPHGEPDPDTWLAHTLCRRVGSWVKHVGGYLKHKDDLKIHIIFYERMLATFDAELSRLLEYLGIELDRQAIEAIKHDVDFTTMKNENPDHVREGKSNKWVQVLTKVQKRQAARIAGPMLTILNYPVNEAQAAAILPQVPEQVTHRQVDQAIARSRRWLVMHRIGDRLRRVCGLSARNM